MTVSWAATILWGVCFLGVVVLVWMTRSLGLDTPTAAVVGGAWGGVLFLVARAWGKRIRGRP